MKKHDIIFTPNFFIQTAILEAPIIRDRYSEDVKRTLEKGYFDSVRFCREQGVRIASGSDFSGARVPERCRACYVFGAALHSSRKYSSKYLRARSP
jgi:hypothetical protein